VTALPSPPEKGERHLVADWIELACLLDEDGSYTGARFAQARGQDEQMKAAAEGEIGRDDDPSAADEWLAEAEDVWRLLRRRADDFGTRYPFDVDPSETSLETLRPTKKRRLYAFLLAASSLNVFATKKKLLTESFERSSRHVVAALLPVPARTEIFGTAAPLGGRYKEGNMIKRLRLLADDLGTELLKSAESVSPHASGDGGLDIVGVPWLAGPKGRLPVIFAQCACGKGWLDKQGEVAPDLWGARLGATFTIVPVTIIPYAFYREDGSWHREFELKPGVIVDRLRWMKLLGDLRDRVYDDVPLDFIDEALPGLSALA